MDLAVKPSQLEKSLMRQITAGNVPIVTSSPGMGKSSIAHKIAKKGKLKLIDIRLGQMTPEDLNGFPMRVNDKASFVPFDIFPVEGDTVPDGYNGWLILLDEITSAVKSVQAAAYKLVLDRMVGSCHLHKKVYIICAGNKMSDKAVVHQMSTALQSRLVHYELKLDFQEWEQWAYTSGMDHRIISFLNFRTDLLMNFKPDHSDKTFACPRTWEMLSNLINGDNNLDDMQPDIAGTVGTGAMVEFTSYLAVYKSLISIHQIKADPSGCQVPIELSTKYAMMSMLIQHINKDNAKELVTYADRFPTEMKAVFVRGTATINPQLRNDSPEFSNMVQQMVRYLKG